MRNTLQKAFDDCFESIKRGEAVESCLGLYPGLREQVTPLLATALSIATVPKVTPSEDFKRHSANRLLSRLLVTPVPRKANPIGRALDEIADLWRGFERLFSGRARVAMPVTLAFILGLQCFLLFGVLGGGSRSGTVLSTHGTLSVVAGSVHLQAPGATTWETASNGMTVWAGARIKTASDAQALLTFFNGTTLTLEGGTEVTVERAEAGREDQPSNIVLKQWIGKTWSRVTKLVDRGSRYEIQTPSAVALVRGTVFVTEVDEKGLTTVQTLEGLVSVAGQGTEVYVPAGQQTTVPPGAAPSAPAASGTSSTGGTAGPGAAATPGSGGSSPAGTGTGGTPGAGAVATPGQGSTLAGTGSPAGQGSSGTPASGAASGTAPSGAAVNPAATAPATEMPRLPEAVVRTPGAGGAATSPQPGEFSVRAGGWDSWRDEHGMQAALALFILLYVAVLMFVALRSR